MWGLSHLMSYSGAKRLSVFGWGQTERPGNLELACWHVTAVVMNSPFDSDQDEPSSVPPQMSPQTLSPAARHRSWELGRCVPKEFFIGRRRKGRFVFQPPLLTSWSCYRNGRKTFANDRYNTAGSNLREQDRECIQSHALLRVLSFSPPRFF